MRAIVAFGIVLLGLNGTAPGLDYAALFVGHLHAADSGAPEPAPPSDSGPFRFEIESVLGKADRLVLARADEAAEAVAPAAAGDKVAAAEPVEDITGAIAAPPAPVRDAAPTPADASANLTDAYAAADDIDDATDREPDVSMDDVCNMLFTSADENKLPVPFFANLIWQESGLRDDIVSRVGAKGIAQFMPTRAQESGLRDPFNPLAAIPASAKLLHELRDQFGNLGYAAAAYNAGPRRVTDWLEHHGTLPRETRDYVVSVTGRTIEQWRSAPPRDDQIAFNRRLACRDRPAYAVLEHGAVQTIPAAAADAAQGGAAQNSALIAAAAADDHPQETNHHVIFRGHHAWRHRGRVRFVINTHGGKPISLQGQKIIGVRGDRQRVQSASSR